ncbi:Putative peptidase S53, activation domain, peptidase S8, subtilisin, Ser-active, Sedolisin [Septoria linicola]|uniref:tripeptidyl-peptidase II n=1 Tax=Septoria linicola TaxID=215465 RepID=A0A9Q9ELC5_9PEZI|nr:Putative peptidase S53, activation domain, peptidase S8, subtilisin, Ser-active, Sedolisin [Septoria linicola]
MLLSRIVCAFGTISTAYALPRSSRSSYAVKERHNVPRGWTRVGEAGRADRIHLSIGLKQQNEGVVEEHLLQVSDPSHPRYGQHLTAAEIEDIIRPSQETQDLVKSWLEEHGIQGVHNSAKDTIHVLIPIEQAEELLQTSYSIFEHEDGSTLARTPEWSLPAHLHEHIDVVQPTNSFFRTKPKYQGGASLQMDTVQYSDAWWQSQAKAAFSPPPAYKGSGAGPIEKICNISFTTPDCKRTLYGTYDYKPQVPGKNKIGHTNYLNETSYRKDIYKALQTFRPEAAQAAYQFKETIIANGNADQGPYTAAQLAAGKNQEAVLDSENILSIVWPTPMEVWNTGGSPPFKPDINTPTDTNEPYLVWLDYVLNQKDVPQVISTSYGDDEQTVPESYAKRACAGFAQLGARGISLFFSSGDAGVGGDGTCFTNDGKNTSHFLPSFPASCPWVTTVGGTEAFQPEVAVKRFASGGGFSDYFPAPSYQTKTVNAYVKSLKGLHDGLYNKAGRAYPDVSAQSNRDAIVWNGTIRTIGGTSASSPTFAAVISLVNDALIAKGKPTLGFLNPWLYSGAYKALTDVKSGSSFGCNTTGFPAQAGWDAVTGFGTPNFPKLVDAAFAQYAGKPKGY